MLKSGKSYALISESDFIKNIIGDYIITINEESGITTSPSIFGKQIILSDTATPTKRSIVLSKKERNIDDIENFIIDDKLAKLLFHINKVDIDKHKSIFNYINNKSKKINIELSYYCILICIYYIDDITIERIDKIFSNKYNGIHTSVEQYQTLIDFINNPTEVNLHHLLKVFNDDNYQKMINCVSVLVNETPEWLVNRFGDYLNDRNFIKKLLKLSLIILKSDSRESFILHSLYDLIYK